MLLVIVAVIAYICFGWLGALAALVVGGLVVGAIEGESK